MRDKITRKEKIRILQAVKEHKLNVESLQPPQVYIFVESSTNPGVYTMKGKQYSETEYRQFCEKIRAKGNNSIIWNEGKNYPKEDKIVTVRHVADPIEKTFSESRTKSLQPPHD